MGVAGEAVSGCLVTGWFQVVRCTCGISNQVFMMVKPFTAQSLRNLSPDSLHLPPHVSLAPPCTKLKESLSRFHCHSPSHVSLAPSPTRHYLPISFLHMHWNPPVPLGCQGPGLVAMCELSLGEPTQSSCRPCEEPSSTNMLKSSVMT